MFQNNLFDPFSIFQIKQISVVSVEGKLCLFANKSDDILSNCPLLLFRGASCLQGLSANKLFWKTAGLEGFSVNEEQSVEENGLYFCIFEEGNVVLP